MPATSETAFRSVIGKIEKYADVTQTDREAFLSMPFIHRSLESSTYVVRESDQIHNCSVLLSGFAHRYKRMADGGRQIIAVHIPGDFLDLQNVMLGPVRQNVQMVTTGAIATVPATEIEAVTQKCPSLQRALWMDTLIDASIFAEWVANVGRRDARGRISHLLCELAVRLRDAGLITDYTYELPMTQEQLADATGLTPVHVNRTLQSLRKSELIKSNGRSITIRDWQALTRVGDFDPSYLFPRSRAAPRLPFAAAS